MFSYSSTVFGILNSSQISVRSKTSSSANLSQHCCSFFFFFFFCCAPIQSPNRSTNYSRQVAHGDQRKHKDFWAKIWISMFFQCLLIAIWIILTVWKRQSVLYVWMEKMRNMNTRVFHMWYFAKNQKSQPKGLWTAGARGKVSSETCIFQILLAPDPIKFCYSHWPPTPSAKSLLLAADWN